MIEPAWILIALISVASLALIAWTAWRILQNTARLRQDSQTTGAHAMETWDLYDQDRQPLHQTHNRQDRMMAGTHHVVVQIWTVNNRRELLLTLRHPDKPFGLYWECTGGSILAGESSRAGAVRELLEETGISAAAEELQLLGNVREGSSFIDSYVVCKTLDLADLTLQPGETVDAQWVSLAQLDQMLADGKIADPIGRRLAEVRTVLESFIEDHAGRKDLT